MKIAPLGTNTSLWDTRAGYDLMIQQQGRKTFLKTGLQKVMYKCLEKSPICSIRKACLGSFIYVLVGRDSIRRLRTSGLPFVITQSKGIIVNPFKQ